jgi:hypothetical protein
MAKKKSKKGVHGTRRHKPRRVGAMKPGSIEHFALMVLGGVAGAAAGAYANQAATTALATAAASTPWLPPAIVGAAGTGILVLTKDHPLGEGFGLGMIAVGGVMVLNQTFLNVPGISGMSMDSNAGPESNVIRKSVGNGPKNYIDATVGTMGRRHRAMGALGTN